jgi:hypothetical protein
VKRENDIKRKAKAAKKMAPIKKAIEKIYQNEISAHVAKPMKING